MKCLLLAAGYATRLYPLTENYPKPLLPVGGKPIVDWLLHDIASTQLVDEYVLISNHKFIDHFTKWAASSQLPIALVDDGTTSNDTRLGAVRDLLFAIQQTGIDDDLLILAGDNMLDFSLEGFLHFAQEKQTSCVMCHEENDLRRQQKTAIITVDSDQQITSYEEKPSQPKGHLAVPPFYFIRKNDARRLQEALDSGCNPDAPGSFAAWLSHHVPMHAYPMPGKRYDIGDLPSYEAAQQIFK